MKKVLFYMESFLLCACILCGCSTTPAGSLGAETSSVNTTTTVSFTTTTPTTTTKPSGTDTAEHFPGFDADTVLLSVSFPADFSRKPYTDKTLTAPSDFSWGRYVPFVQCNGQGYRRHLCYYDAGFITSNCTSLRDACLLYDKLNALYLTESEVVDVKFLDTSYANPVTQAPYTILGRPMYVDMLFRSHIVSLSPDLKRVGKLSFSYQGEGQIDFLNEAELWQDQYEIYQDGVLVQSLRQSNTVSSYEDEFFYDRHLDYFYTRQSPTEVAAPSYVQADGAKRSLTVANEQLAVYTDMNGRFGIYAVQDMNLLYEVTFERELTDQGWRYIVIPQVIQDRYLLLEVSEGSFDLGTDFNCVYLYDLKTGAMTFLEEYAYYASLSPDGKYLAYTAPFGEDMGYQDGAEIPMQQGFYIKNLQDGTTTFFADVGGGSIAGWVDEQILMQTIGESLSVPIEIGYASEEMLNKPNEYIYFEDHSAFNNEWKIMLYTASSVCDVTFWEMDESEVLTAVRALYTVEELTAQKPLILSTYINDATVNRGISFVDEQNNTRYFAIQWSGRDGNLSLQEVNI